MQKMIFIMLLLALSACSNLELDELLATSATATTAGVATAVGLPPATTLVVSAATGTVVSTQTGPSVEVMAADFAGEDGELGPFELLAFAWATFTNHLITLGVLIGGFWLASLYLGARKKRPEEKALEKQLIKLFKEANGNGK